MKKSLCVLLPVTLMALSMTTMGCVLDEDYADPLAEEYSAPLVEEELQGDGEELQGDGEGPQYVPNACRWAFAAADIFYYPLSIYVTNILTTSSGCGHIWAQNYKAGCVWARIRYYPSSGGSYTSSWLQVCNGSYVSFSNDVLAGTRFRVETSSDNAEFALDI